MAFEDAPPFDPNQPSEDVSGAPPFDPNAAQLDSSQKDNWLGLGGHGPDTSYLERQIYSKLVGGLAGLPGLPGYAVDAAGRAIDWAAGKALTPEQMEVYKKYNEENGALPPVVRDIPTPETFVKPLEKYVTGPLPQEDPDKPIQNIVSSAVGMAPFGPGGMLAGAAGRAAEELAPEEYKEAAGLAGMFLAHPTAKAVGNAARDTAGRFEAARPSRASNAVDMDALARDIQQAPPFDPNKPSIDFGATAETHPGSPPEPVAPVAPAATSREGLDVRLMPHDVPHVAPEGGYRSSVGAAGSPTDVLANYSPQTITVAKEILADSGLNNPHMLEQALEGTSQHHTFAELSLPMQEEAARLYAASGRGEGAKNTISQTYLGRAEEEPQRIGAALDRGLGSPQNLADLTKTTELERAKASDPLYKSFRNTVVRPTQEIRELMTTPTMQKAMKYANGALADERLPSSQGFARTVTDADGNWVEDIEHTPTAQAFQYAKEYIDGLIERTMAQPGGGSEARRYTLLKNQLVNALDNHPDPNVAGVWKAARQAYAEPSELLDAQKFGRKLLTNNVDREDLPHLTEGWSDAQMERARIGVRGYLESLAKSNRSPTRASNKLLDAVLSPGNQEKLRWMIGDDKKADELIAAIEHEESMHGAPTRIIGGSPSANRLLNNRYVPAPSALENISLHDITHPKGTIAKGLAKVGLDRMAQKRTVEAAKLRDELSRMFTTQGAERNAVARALIGADEPPVAGWSSPAPVAPSAAKVAASVEAPVPSFSPANVGGWRPVTAEQIAAANRPVVPPAAIETAAPEAKGLSALEFLASKGGLKATPELLGIMGKNKFLGSHGWVFRSGGLSEDKARELLAEAGYIRNEGRGGTENRGGGTSTIRDFHEVVNDEARGRKRYAVGEDGAGKVDPDEARHRFESDVMDHFAQEGAPVPDGKMRDRVVELVRDEGMSPLAAHEQAVMEEHYAGQDEGVAGRTGAVPVDAGTAPASRSQVAPGAREPEGAGTGEAPFLPREGNPEAPGSEAEIARLKTESTARMADRLGVTDRVKTMASAGRTDEEISNALAGKLKPDEVATLREHLGLSPAGSLLAPGEADFDIPFPLKRNVLQRDASGRPMRTAPIPIGTEEKILQAGFDRSRGLGLPQFARGGAVLSMRTRTESHYSPTRGKPNHHCGEDKDWQTGWCKHFRKPHSCSEVAGHIATKGGCDWYEWVGYPQERADGGRLVCGGDIPEHQSEAQWRSDPPQGIGEPEPLQRASGGRIPPHYVDQNPTEAQREAGNYKKAHTRIHSLDITIENPKGTWRQGIGKEGVWKVQLPFHYGYLLGSKAKDGDHVDVAIGPHPQSKKVFVIDQHDAETGKYDEVKCVMGCGSESQARSLYLKSFSDGKGKARLGHLTEMDVDSFKDWLKNGDTTKPLKGADHATMPKVDRTLSVRWLSELSADGLVMFLDKSVPRRVVIKGKVIDPAEPLLRHEMAEYKAMKAASAGFEKEHDRKPDDSERKDIYKSAHRDHGTVAEREYVKGVGLDWDAWSRWCAGELSRLEKMKPVNPPLKPDVRPFPHGRGDLEFTG